MIDEDILHATDTLPWAPVRAGFSLKVLHGRTDDETRALLLRLEPGTVIPRHRHEGEVHAINLRGERKLLDTGEVVGPGGYVYEPAGNVDSWMAVGTEPLVVFVTVRGAIESIDDAGNVTRRTTTASMAEEYARFLAEAKR
jgi:quercetin dioxygenase-like cupin family protein